MIRRLILGAAILIALLGPSASASSGHAVQGRDSHPEGSESPFPLPPGTEVRQNSPLVTAVAVLTIVGAGAAGIYIYRVIRKGL